MTLAAGDVNRLMQLEQQYRVHIVAFEVFA